MSNFNFSRFFLVISSITLAVLLAGSCVDQSKNSIQNRDPNGTSELQLTMRDMYDYFDQMKQDIAAGKKIEDVKIFEHILTDVPTEDGKNQTDIYKTMAEVYFNAAKNLNQNGDQAAFHGLVDACMSCHQQVCPGPMVRIKKLYAEN